MEVKTIPIDLINISETNPRKRFKEESLKELSASIAENGLINPITIRPKGKSYELVAGERRIKASIMAGLRNIDANIRSMTDEQAFDIQVVENLQREDVHPLDEAAGFQKMLDSGRYDVKEIAARVGKSESFVLRRLKYNDLVPELKEEFYDEKIKIGHATELCRLPENQQQELHEGYFADPESHSYMPPVSSLQDTISRTYMLQLEKAIFDSEDPELYAEAGPCSECMKRTSNNPSLFPDLEGADRCTDKACYQMKEHLHLIALIEKHKDDPNYYFVRDYGDPDEKILQKVEDDGITLLREYDDFSTTEESELKGIYLGGWDKGKIVPIKLKMTKKQAEEELPREKFIPQEIERIEERRARKIELDREKVQKRLIEALEAFQPEQEAYDNLGEVIYYGEGWAWNLAVCWILYDGISWEQQKEFHIEWGLIKEENGHYVSGIEVIKYMAEKKDVELHDLFCHLMGGWLLTNCTSPSYLDPDHNAGSFLLRRVAEEVAPKQVKKFDQEQAEEAEKREARYEERIKKLQEELQELKGEEDPEEGHPELVQRLIDHAKEKEWVIAYQKHIVEKAIEREQTAFEDLTAKEAVKVWEYVNSKFAEEEETETT